MEFSWQYTRSIRDLAAIGRGTSLDGTVLNGFSSRDLVCDVNSTEQFEIPACMYNIVRREIRENQYSSFRAVYTLSVADLERNISGPDAIIRYFSGYSAGRGRLRKVITSRGEIYYGNPGIIMDKDFNILLLITAIVRMTPERDEVLKTKVYFSPRVFTDESLSLNKALARKALPFMLSLPINQYGEPTLAEVSIDDCSRFVHTVSKPVGSIPSQESFCEVLKDNIGDLLRQFYYEH